MLKKPDKYFWIANAFIVLSLILFFSRSLFTNRILTSGDFQTYPFFVSPNVVSEKKELPLLDPINFFIPMLHFDRQVLKTGELPLWNPYQGCGVPHIANMQSSVFFPLNIFVYIFHWKWGFFFLYFFKLYFIGLFLYLYLKEIGISPPVAIIFSMAGMYMSFNLTVLYDAFSNAAFFFPLSLWAIELILHPVREIDSLSGNSYGGIKSLKSATFSNKVKKPKDFKGYFILCLGLVFALFGGNPELVFYGTTILIAYFLIRLFQTYSVGLHNAWVPILGNAFIIFIIGILISSIQLLPFLEYFRLSSAFVSRNILDLHITNVPPYILLFSILPTLTVGNMGMLIGNVFNKYETMATIYPGVSIIMLGIAGMIALHKDKIVRAFIFIAIMALCFGFNVPIIHNIIMHIPGFSSGRNYYILIFVSWALVIIGSKSLDNFLAKSIKSRSFKFASLLIIGLIIILGLFFIKDDFSSLPRIIQTAFRYYLTLSIAAAILIIILTLLILKIKNRQLLVILMGVLIYAQTALPMIFIEPAIKPEYFYPKNKIFSMLQKEQKQPFRVTALISNTLPIAYATNINTFYKIEDIRNYDSLGVNWYNSIFPYIRQSDALNLTNVKYIIVKSGYDLSKFTNIFQPIAEYNGFTLYKNLSAFNRAFMVYNYAIANGDQQALDLLHAYSGQLNHVAIVFKKDMQGMPLAATTQGTYTIAFIKYTPGYIKMSCNTSQPGLFFISDTYFPGWHARVDGKKTKIIRTDYAFQGLWLTQGTHIIELNYAPASFKYGVLLTIIGILSLIGFYFIAFRKKELRHKV